MARDAAGRLTGRGLGADCVPVPFADEFTDDLPAGQVVGSESATSSEPTGAPAQRRGIDVERRISIDHGALRLEPLDTPGWGRQGIAYGPFEARPGLTVAFSMLNGHNSSQTEWRVRPRLPARTVNALRGVLGRLRLRVAARLSGVTVEPAVPIPPRLVPAHRSGLDIRDNLAVGWLAAPDGDPPAGPRFVVHATHIRSGELRAGDDRMLRLFDGLQDLPMYYVVSLRPDGAAYYVASMPGSRGPGDYPSLRPVAVTPLPPTGPTARPGTVFAGLQQSILGEAGYRAATRVYGVRVAHLPAWAGAFGTAIAADDGPPTPGRRARLGGTWQQQPDGSLHLDLDEPAGLVRLRVEVTGTRPRVVLRCRAAAPSVGLELAVTAHGATLARRDEHGLVTLARSEARRLARGGTHELQVLDDGATVSVHLDGAPLFDGFVDEGRLAAAAGVAVDAGDADVTLFEAHPRQVPVPTELDMGGPPDLRGTRAVVADDFGGAAGELDGPWARSLGDGRIDRTGEGRAHVRADRRHPNPGRTLYTVPWPDPGLADIEVEITPPGDRRGRGEACRGGLCLWQDPDNFLIVSVYLTDAFAGSAVSSFPRLGGHEGFYDPVWTNVGTAIEPGRPVRLRVVSDGVRYVAHLGGEPVLYRAFSDIYPDAPPLEVRRVGLVANWEFGNDTGTTFRRFRGRGA